MSVDIIFKIAGIGIITAIVNQILKNMNKDEIATLTTLTGLVLVLIMVLNMISDLFGQVRMLFSLYQGCMVAEIFKIIAVGLIVAVLNLIVKQHKPEFAILLTAIGGMIIFIMLINLFGSVFSSLAEIINRAGVDTGLFGTLIKIIGVGYITEFAANICVDMQNNAIADKILLGGKLIILALSMPILKGVVDLIAELV